MKLPTRVEYPVAVIGDVHGNSGPLGRLLDSIDREQPGCSLAFVGDFVDRGPDTRGVLDMVIPLVESGRAAAVAGNHDYALVRSAGLDGRPESAWWVPRYLSIYNATATFASYLSPPFPGWGRNDLYRLRDEMPLAHREFLSNLPWGVTTADESASEGHLIVHSGLSNQLTTSTREQFSALLAKQWDCSTIRSGSSLSFKEADDYPPWLGSDRHAAKNPLPLPGWVQVVGHAYTRTPQDLGHAIRVDTTGGGSSSPMTACILDGPGCKPRFVSSAQQAS